MQLTTNSAQQTIELGQRLGAALRGGEIIAITGKDPVERWNGSPPRGIVVTISFAEPYKKADGTFDVPDEEKIIRTIAVDRTRKIRFDTSRGDFGGNEEGQENVNLPSGEKPATGSTRKVEKTK